MTILEQEIKDYLYNMKFLEKTYMGFPNNMSYDWDLIAESSKVYINNCGDPFSTLSWKKHSKPFEQEVVKYFLSLYKLDIALGWGYMTAGGTEGNMEGLFIAREIYPDGVLYISEDAHYSLQKIANILRMRYIIIRSLENGEINYDELEHNIQRNKHKPVILSLTCGTTVRGAYDNLEKVKEVLERNQITKKYIHVDAALSGMIVPFISRAPQYTFDKGVDSVAISMHKFLGCPLMSGIVITKKEYADRISTKVEYINSHDTTILGSRNGQVPLYVYATIQKYGTDRFALDAKRCISRAKYLYSKLKKINIAAKLNKFSTTVYFFTPNRKIVDKWQLSVYGNIAHVVVMQHVTRDMIDRFVKDLERNR